MLRRERDERAGRAGVGVDERVGRDRGAIQNVRDFFGRVESPAVGVHFKNDRGGAVALGEFLSASQKHQQRERDLAAQRHDDDIAFVNRVRRVRVRRQDKRGRA